MATGFRVNGEDLGNLFDVSGSDGVIVTTNTNFTSNNIDLRYNFKIFENVIGATTNYITNGSELNTLFQGTSKIFNVYYSNMTTYDGVHDGTTYTFYEATSSTNDFIITHDSSITEEVKTNNPNVSASILLLGGGGGGARPNCALSYQHRGGVLNWWSQNLGGGGGAGAMGEATNYNLPVGKTITTTIGNGGISSNDGQASTLVIDGTTVATAYGGAATHRISGQNRGSGAGAHGGSHRDTGNGCGLQHGASRTQSQVGEKGTNNVTTYGSFTFYANRGGHTGSYDVNDASKVSGAGGGGGAGGVGGDRRIIGNNWNYGGHGGSGRTWINGVTYAAGGGGASSVRNVVYNDGGVGGSGIGGSAGNNYDKVWESWIAFFTVNSTHSGFSGDGGHASPANRGSGGGGGLHHQQAHDSGNGSAGITIYAIPKSVILASHTPSTLPGYIVETTQATISTVTYNSVDYYLYSFKSSSGSMKITRGSGSTVSGVHILLVGGGGAGGAIVHDGQWLLGGGGGAGGYGELSNGSLPTNTTISFTIGAGGDRSANYTQTLGGRNNTNDLRMYSGFSTHFDVGGTRIASAYGGVGAGNHVYSGDNGASGAGKHGSMGNGSSHYGGAGGAHEGSGGTTNDTTYGTFTFFANTGGNAFYSAGGGGGAGGPGGNGSGAYGTYAGNGGASKTWYINNEAYANGGGGARWARQGIGGGGGASEAGQGGAGADVWFINNQNTNTIDNATSAANAAANRGGGGGGRGCCGGAGGSGIAIVAIPVSGIFANA